MVAARSTQSLAIAMNMTSNTVTGNSKRQRTWITGLWLSVVLFAAGFGAGMYVMSPERPTAYLFISVAMTISAGVRLLRLLSRQGAAS